MSGVEESEGVHAGGAGVGGFGRGEGGVWVSA